MDIWPICPHVYPYMINVPYRFCFFFDSVILKLDYANSYALCLWHTVCLHSAYINAYAVLCLCHALLLCSYVLFTLYLYFCFYSAFVLANFCLCSIYTLLVLSSDRAFNLLCLFNVYFFYTDYVYMFDFFLMGFSVIRRTFVRIQYILLFLIDINQSYQQ